MREGEVEKEKGEQVFNEDPQQNLFSVLRMCYKYFHCKNTIILAFHHSLSNGIGPTVQL